MSKFTKVEIYGRAICRFPSPQWVNTPPSLWLQWNELLKVCLINVAMTESWSIQGRTCDPDLMRQIWTSPMALCAQRQGWAGLVSVGEKLLGGVWGKQFSPLSCWLLRKLTQPFNTECRLVLAGQSTDWTPRQPEWLYKVSHTTLSPCSIPVSVFIFPPLPSRSLLLSSSLLHHFLRSFLRFLFSLLLCHSRHPLLLFLPLPLLSTHPAPARLSPHAASLLAQLAMITHPG